MKLSDWAVGLSFMLVVVLAFVFGASFRIVHPDPTPSETCWRDPHAQMSLDFDFHTFVNGTPIRCGYMAPRPGSVLLRVLGEMDRGVFSDVRCYPLESIKCP